MPSHPFALNTIGANGSVCVLTLGGQPQVVTLTLDALIERGESFDEVHVVHLALDDPRYQNAYQRLGQEFQDETYRSRPCHYESHIVTLHHRPLSRLDSEDALDAVRDRFANLFAALKQRERQIHLCISGGPRLMGHIAIAMAQQLFCHTDRIWHLHSSEEIRHQTRDGAQMHLASLEGVRLLQIRIPLIVSGVAMRQSDETRRRCQAVYDELTPALKPVLRDLAQGMTAAQIAEHLHLSRGTIDNYKSSIFRLCERYWEGESINSAFLVRMFSTFF